MIIIKLLGGLGNQMFQYALGRALAVQHQDELFLDCSFFSEKGSHTPREFELDIFDIKASIASDEHLKAFIPEQPTLLGRIMHRLRGTKPVSKSYHEHGHQFHPEVFDLRGDMHLIGYWQTEHYFKQVENIIREDFTFKHPATGLNAELLQKINACNAVSLHIRRGDYVTNTSANSFHGLCGLDYYNAAVQWLMQHEQNMELFVFSDDIAWAKENLKYELPMTFIDHNTGKNSWEDMRLMSHCKHNIIANSSFSWWAAWLNPNKEKRVIAPKQWFADTTINTKDVIPTSWKKL